MTTKYGERPGMSESAPVTCTRCHVALTDETRHDLYDHLCQACGEWKEQIDYDAREDRMVDAAREREMLSEWGRR